MTTSNQRRASAGQSWETHPGLSNPALDAYRNARSHRRRGNVGSGEPVPPPPRRGEGRSER